MQQLDTFAGKKHNHSMNYSFGQRPSTQMGTLPADLATLTTQAVELSIKHHGDGRAAQSVINVVHMALADGKPITQAQWDALLSSIPGYTPPPAAPATGTVESQA